MFESIEEYDNYLKTLSLDQLIDIRENIDEKEYPDRFNLVVKYISEKQSINETKRKKEKSKIKPKSVKLNNGYELVKDSIKIFALHPRLVFPLLVCWCIYAPIIVYLKFFVDWNSYGLREQMQILFFVILIFSFIFSISCLILLELIEQRESGKRMSIIKATFSAITVDLIRAFPITIIWALLWFLISIIESFFRRGDDEDDDTDFTAENVARTVAGFESFSLSRAFFEALKKGIRMIVFLILPAIAWEAKSPIKAFKKGLGIAMVHNVEFITGFVLTELAAAFVFLPPAILFILSGKFNITFPDYIWFITIIYCGLAWSFYVFIEQMFTAELYLWHLKWEEKCAIAKSNNHELPELEDVRRPSIMDDIPDLVKVARKEV